MSAYHILVHFHSIMRWLVVAGLIIAMINALFRILRQTEYEPHDSRMNLFAMIWIHLQFLLGLVLYFISPKVVFSGASMGNPILRYFLVEHVLVMLVAIVLVTIGYIRAKRAGDPQKKHRKILIYYTIGLILILAAIPWPFLQYGGKLY